MKEWIKAFRLRTLPLSLSCIGTGGVLAYLHGVFSGVIFSLAILTTVLLQILSNLANDFGDSQNGADNEHREGPSRSVQEGKISMKAMKHAIIIFSVLSFVSGLLLLLVSFPDWLSTIVFVGIGLLCIAAAIKYTAGNNPYGYAGLGDLSVFVFFGLVGVLGTRYLFNQSIMAVEILPAISLGSFSCGVLNINNIRDIDSDAMAGKRSIPVRIGRTKAMLYHWSLLVLGMASFLAFALLRDFTYWMYLPLLSFPLFVKNGVIVTKNKVSPAEIDPGLKQLSLSTLLFVVLFWVGVMV